MTLDPLNPGRDTVLGDALRAALGDPAGDGAFIASVLAQSKYQAPRPYVSDALASWSRWGVAAAAAVIAVLLAVQPSRDANASLDDALTETNPEPLTTLMADDASPGAVVLFAPSGEER